MGRPRQRVEKSLAVSRRDEAIVQRDRTTEVGVDALQDLSDGGQDLFHLVQFGPRNVRGFDTHQRQRIVVGQTLVAALAERLARFARRRDTTANIGRLFFGFRLRGDGL
mgnify:CR=1 FL=1